MKESVTYQAILEEGKVEGMVEARKKCFFNSGGDDWGCQSRQRDRPPRYYRPGSPLSLD